MSKLSWRHHYIPQFYLKGFVNQNNTFAIYDKKKDRIKSGEHSTKSHFFEENRNLVEVNGVETDFLESELYKGIDNDIGKLFQNIKDDGIDFLTPESLFTLKMFISFLYWRIPSNDELLQKTIDKYDFKELGFDIKAKKPDDSLGIEKVKKQLKEDPSFRKMYGIILPFSPNNTFSVTLRYGEAKMWKAIGDPKNSYHLTCDSPIITLRKDMFYGDQQKLLFPVTNKKLLFYGKTEKDGKLPPKFFIHKDLAVLHSAERYVCGPDKRYLEDIVELYRIRKEFNDIDNIVPELFSYFD